MIYKRKIIKIKSFVQDPSEEMRKRVAKNRIVSKPLVHKISPKRFYGRYNRVMGSQASTFRIKYISGQWWPVLTLSNDDTKYVCPAVECEATHDLVEVVNKAKWAMTRSEGGAFLVDEFSRIIVPNSKGNGERMLVGELRGVLDFENPNDCSIFNLNDDDGLGIGKPWPYPYVGVECHLSKKKKIYSYIEDDDEKETVFSKPDNLLVQVLMKIRGWRGCRFIVNPHGIVLTKKMWNNDKFDWRPVYAGRIDYSKWFENRV